MAQPDRGKDKLVSDSNVGDIITLITRARAVILTRKPTDDPRGFVDFTYCHSGTNPEFCKTCDERAKCPLFK
ncbi:MAG: hypothetical protein WA152_00580 [Microgenomates group bacterium]